MKMLLGLIAAIGFAGTASAATDINFTLTQSGYVTDTGDTIEYANIAYVKSGYGFYRVVISVDGQAYTGYTDVMDAQFQAVKTDIVNGIIAYDQGTQITASVEWSSRTSCTHSGRGQHCTTWRTITLGEVLLP
jgi:hypothetical protein